ncbi:MAG: class I SAM-dependent methyltransferase [Ignavibacteriae bacterium]|nr:class I SAM-dependent methyltransferase [Ignavibacteriota bacterium]
MKVRNSGMPEEEMWDSFFNPEEVLRKLELHEEVKDVVEFGSGYGTFSIPASKIINGYLYAIDIEPNLIKLVQNKLQEKNINNVILLQRDFVKDGTGLENETVEYIMLFNILHTEEPISLLMEASRILKKNGRIAIIHWIYSEDTPRGPSLNIRPKPEQCIDWLKVAGFDILKKEIDLPPYHYGIIGIKK